MEKPITNQKKAKSQLRPGEYILFAENNSDIVNSAVVKSYEFIPGTEGVITVETINGESRDEAIELSTITLYREEDWEDIT